MVENIINAIKNEVDRHGLELMKRYPNDLEVVDRSVLERFAHPRAKFAWLIGHTHTHMAPMGVHKELNKLPTYVQNLSEDDRFYVVEVGYGQFQLKELSREKFVALSSTAIAYHMVGTNQAFWLYRGPQRIGTCIIKASDTGGFENRLYEIKLAPCEGISPYDKAALEYWGQRAVVETTHSLFTAHKTTWEEPIALAA